MHNSSASLHRFLENCFSIINNYNEYILSFHRRPRRRKLERPFTMQKTRYICVLCRSAERRVRPTLSIGFRDTIIPTYADRRKFSQMRRQSTAYDQAIIHRHPSQSEQSKPFWGNDWTVFSADNAALVKKAQVLGNAIINDQTIPAEEEVLKTLEFIKFAALQLNTVQTNWQKKEDHSKQDEAVERVIFPNQKLQSQGVTAGLLSDIQVDTTAGNAVSAAIATKLLSTLAHKIVVHPPVFITPKILESYVAIQVSLHSLSTLPEVFDLYAHKPVPKPESSPIQYAEPNPNKPTQAVPEQLANQALDAAIKMKDLPLALDMIGATFSMTAFRRNKFIRKALPLVGSLMLTPFVIVPLAAKWASHSMAADQTALMLYGSVGMLAYVGTLSGLGFIAITTYNDQMHRVTWMPGMPLRDRWLREEERSAADKVALAWGFKDINMRGQEDGEDWALLNEWCLRKGMLIDSSELMDGME